MPLRLLVLPYQLGATSELYGSHGRRDGTQQAHWRCRKAKNGDDVLQRQRRRIMTPEADVASCTPPWGALAKTRNERGITGPWKTFLVPLSGETNEDIEADGHEVALRCVQRQRAWTITSPHKRASYSCERT